MNSGDMMCRPGALEMMVGMIDALANSALPCTGILILHCAIIWFNFI